MKICPCDQFSTQNIYHFKLNYQGLSWEKRFGITFPIFNKKLFMVVLFYLELKNKNNKQSDTYSSIAAPYFGRAVGTLKLIKALVSLIKNRKLPMRNQKTNNNTDSYHIPLLAIIGNAYD